MGKFTFHPVKSLQSDPKLRMLCLFGIEGFLLQYAVSLYTLANNLYATNLGATDTQIGLVQMVPNMVAGICMIPCEPYEDEPHGAVRTGAVFERGVFCLRLCAAVRRAPHDGIFCVSRHDGGRHCAV